MAIDLVAKLRLDDKFSNPLSKAMLKMDSASKATGKLEKSTSKTTQALGKFSTGTTSVTTGLVKMASKFNPVTTGLSAIAAAAVGAYSAVKIFNATVGEAMKMEQSQVVIGAMFNDKDLSNQYMKMLDKVAIKSPVLDSQQMYSNSKSFITASKDLKQLEKMWNLAERMAALDPAQGVEGAVFALRELFSGDAVSMVERFEMSRDVMNDIKKLDLDDQLSALDKYFNKIGITYDVVEAMGNTALGKWTQVKERFQIIMRDMGEPALEAVSTFLNKALSRLEGSDMKKFAEWGGRVINNMVTGLSNSAIRLYDWFTALTSSSEFQSKSTLTGKVNFIIEDIAEKFQSWWNNGGQQKIIDFGSGVAQILVSALDATDEIFLLGAKLGVSVWNGILDGIKASAAESPVGKILSGLISMTPQEMIPNATNKITEYWGEKGWFGYGDENENKSYTPSISGHGRQQRQSHYHGLNYVPNDGYKATLHKEEAVLNAQEAKAWREGKSGGSSVTVTGNTFVVRDDSDIEKIAYKLAKYIEREAAQVG